MIIHGSVSCKYNMGLGNTFKVSAKISLKKGGRSTSVKHASTVRYVTTIYAAARRNYYFVIYIDIL